MDFGSLIGRRKAAGHTFDSFSQHWLKIHSLKVTASSTVTYRKMLVYLTAEFGKRPIASITRQELKMFVAGLVGRLSTATIRLVMNVAVMVFDEAAEDGLIPGNPAIKVAGRVLPRDREETRTKALDKDQLGRFLAVAAEQEPQHYPTFFLLSRTGLRISEAMALRWEDIDLPARCLTVRKSKSGRPRTVPLAADLVEALTGVTRIGPLVLGDRDGRVASQTTLRYACKRVLKAAGLDTRHSLHGLRHSLASILEHEGVPLEYIGRILGHSDLRTTKVYAYGLAPNGEPVDKISAAVPAPLPVILGLLHLVQETGTLPPATGQILADKEQDDA